MTRKKITRYKTLNVDLNRLCGCRIVLTAEGRKLLGIREVRNDNK